MKKFFDQLEENSKFDRLSQKILKIHLSTVEKKITKFVNQLCKKNGKFVHQLHEKKTKKTWVLPISPGANKQNPTCCQLHEIYLLVEGICCKIYWSLRIISQNSNWYKGTLNKPDQNIFLEKNMPFLRTMCLFLWNSHPLALLF